jgi:hypothetical protein
MSYPKWKFKGPDKQLVQTPDDEKALGRGWGDTPGFSGPTPEPESESEGEDPHKDPKNKKK